MNRPSAHAVVVPLLALLLGYSWAHRPDASGQGDRPRLDIALVRWPGPAIVRYDPVPGQPPPRRLIIRHISITTYGAIRGLATQRVALSSAAWVS
jgi:hypothetical protein